MSPALLPTRSSSTGYCDDRQGGHRDAERGLAGFTLPVFETGLGYQ